MCHYAASCSAAPIHVCAAITCGDNGISSRSSSVWRPGGRAWRDSRMTPGDVALDTGRTRTALPYCPPSSSFNHIVSSAALPGRLYLRITMAPSFIHRKPYPQPFQCLGSFRPKHYDVKICLNHINAVMLVFNGKLSMSTLR